MTDFYIFRHGDTIDSGSLMAKIFGHRHDSHDLDILPRATPALKKTGDYLKDIKTDMNFTSPYLRCVKSSDIVGTIAKKKFIKDARLAELESHGESFSSFHNRVRDFMEEIHKKNYHAVSICTHGAVIGAIKHFEISGRFYFFNIFDYPSPGVLTIIKDGAITEKNFNSN